MIAQPAKRKRALHAFVAAIVLLGLLAFSLTFTTNWPDVDPQVTVGGVLTFVFVGFGLEIGWRRLRMGSAIGSMAFVAFLGAALVFGPMWGALVTAVCLGATHGLNRRPLIKVAFNIGQYVLGIVLGSWAYLVIGGTIPPHSLNATLIPFAAFVVVFVLVNSCSVSGVIALSENRSFTEVWVRNTWSVIIYDVVGSTLGLAIAWLYLQFGFRGVGAVVIPILFMRHTYAVNLELQETHRELLELMVKAIEARDPYTSGHSQRVSELARRIARSLRMRFKDVESVGTAALLHDVGKIYDEFAPILRKEGRLTPEERALMETHPVRSAELIGTISSLHGQVYKSVRHHHERFDGSGYPDGLVGQEIPLGARIIMVADTLDAMTTDRPYRKALPFEKVYLELQKYSGTQFDPEVILALYRSLERKRVIDRSGSAEELPRVSDQERVAQLVGR